MIEKLDLARLEGKPVERPCCQFNAQKYMQQ